MMTSDGENKKSWEEFKWREGLIDLSDRILRLFSNLDIVVGRMLLRLNQVRRPAAFGRDDGPPLQ